MIGPLLLYTSHPSPRRGFFLSLDGQVLSAVKWGTNMVTQIYVAWTPSSEKNEDEKKMREVTRRRMDYIGVI